MYKLKTDKKDSFTENISPINIFKIRTLKKEEEVTGEENEMKDESEFNPDQENPDDQQTQNDDQQNQENQPDDPDLSDLKLNEEINDEEEKAGLSIL